MLDYVNPRLRGKWNATMGGIHKTFLFAYQVTFCELLFICTCFCIVCAFTSKEPWFEIVADVLLAGMSCLS